MGRFLIILGIGLILITVGGFVFSLVGMESARFAAIVEQWVCDTEETLQVVTGVPRIDSDGSTVQSINIYCHIGENIQRDVTGLVFGGIVGGFIGGLLLGIGLIFWGALRVVRQQRQHMVSMMQTFQVSPTQASVIDLRSSTIDYDQIPPQAQAILQTVLQSLTSATGSLQGDTLAERLKELEDARQQGLISQQEYDRIRTALLDKMDD